VLTGPDLAPDDEAVGVQGHRHERGFAAQQIEHAAKDTRGRPPSNDPIRPVTAGRSGYPLAPAVTSCSAPCWSPSYRAPTVSSVSISSGVLSGRRFAIRGKRSE